MIFFFASPQTSSSVNTTSHEQNNCMCLSLLIVMFRAAVYAHWAYCSLSPAIYPCALFCSSGFVHTDISVSPFPHPLALIAVLFSSRAPLLLFAHALAFVLHCVSYRPCIDPRVRPLSCLVARLRAHIHAPLPPPCRVDCCVVLTRPPLPFMLLTRLRSRRVVSSALY